MKWNYLICEKNINMFSNFREQKKKVNLHCQLLKRERERECV
jgi:hypothetical protein